MPQAAGNLEYARPWDQLPSKIINRSKKLSFEPKLPPKLPFHLAPTSLPGVYTAVPPPKGTDLTYASRTTLLRHGITIGRPDPDRDPKRFALWRRFVNEIWTEENYVAPTFEAAKSTPHGMKGGVRQPEGPIKTSGGWSGAVLLAKPFKTQWVGAMGMWTVPEVSPPTTPVDIYTGVWQSSCWVGLDGGAGVIPGTTTTDVLQAGTSQNVVQSTGKPAYYAWFEWVVAGVTACPDPNPDLPDYVCPQTITSVPVQAGHEISVVIQYGQKGGTPSPTPPAGPYSCGQVVLTNLTTGQTSGFLYLIPPQGASFAGESAEWIVECPDGLARGTLPKFSSVTFQSCAACNVGDAPPAGEIGVELQKAVPVVFEDFEGNVETSVIASGPTVTVNY